MIGANILPKFVNTLPGPEDLQPQHDVVDQHKIVTICNIINTLPGPRDLQSQRKGTSLQAANLFGAVGGEIYFVSSF